MKRPILLFGRVGAGVLPKPLRRRFSVMTMRIGTARLPGRFFTDAESVRRLSGSAWNARRLDLLNLMCALRAADRFYESRGVFEDTRAISLAISVTVPRFWLGLAAHLKRVVFALSSDQLALYPVPLGRMPRLARPYRESALDGLLKRYQPDCVCLFSGGADSFCGAAYLLAQGRRPLLVSHAVGPISGRQQELAGALRRRFPILDEDALVQVRAYPLRTASRRGWRQQDGLQRMRSMFFFSLAALVGSAHDIDDLFMCENGIVAAAIAFSPHMHDPYNTRPAEPHFLREMESFLGRALPRPGMRIRNPFQYRTKGEVLRDAAALGLERDLYRTVSCWASGNRGVRNCGRCVPCLFRQLSFDEAGLRVRSRDYSEHAIPRVHWRRWQSRERHRLLALKDYCDRVAGGGRQWLHTHEPAVIDAIDVTGGPVGHGAEDGLTQLDRDNAAPEMMAGTIGRFASATLSRLQD